MTMTTVPFMLQLNWLVCTIWTQYCMCWKHTQQPSWHSCHSYCEFTGAHACADNWTLQKRTPLGTIEYCLQSDNTTRWLQNRTLGWKISVFIISPWSWHSCTNCHHCNQSKHVSMSYVTAYSHHSQKAGQCFLWIALPARVLSQTGGACCPADINIDIPAGVR